MLTGRLFSGALLLCNHALIDWFLKCQATEETDKIVLEFTSAIVAVDQIIELRTTLRYLRVPVNERITCLNIISLFSQTVPSHTLHWTKDIICWLPIVWENWLQHIFWDNMGLMGRITQQLGVSSGMANNPTFTVILWQYRWSSGICRWWLRYVFLNLWFSRLDVWSKTTYSVSNDFWLEKVDRKCVMRIIVTILKEDHHPVHIEYVVVEILDGISTTLMVENWSFETPMLHCTPVPQYLPDTQSETTDRCIGNLRILWSIHSSKLNDSWWRYMTFSGSCKSYHDGCWNRDFKVQ
jgi:hypothetical protein